jgi:hypothetical protein
MLGDIATLVVMLVVILLPLLIPIALTALHAMRQLRRRPTRDGVGRDVESILASA